MYIEQIVGIVILLLLGALLFVVGFVLGWWLL